MENTNKPAHEETFETTTATAATGTTKEITYQNVGSKVDKSKPYFVVNNGEWQLIVPQMDNKPALQIPVTEFAKLNEAVARASARSGMPVDMSKMLAAEEIHVKSDEITSPSIDSTPAVPAVPVKKQKSPASSFVQEAENVKSEEEEKATITTTPKALSEEEVIVLNGKRYKLLNEEKPKKKTVKKAKKTQAKGKTGAKPVTVPPPTTSPPSIPITQPTQFFQTPMQLPGVNQPFSPATLGQLPQSLTIEQQQILAELQQRYFQSQSMLTKQQQTPQNPNFILNGETYNPRVPSLANPGQLSQPFYEKIRAPEIIPQMQKAAIDPVIMRNPPIKVQPTLAVIEQPKSIASATPTQIVKVGEIILQIFTYLYNEYVFRIPLSIWTQTSLSCLYKSNIHCRNWINFIICNIQKLRQKLLKKKSHRVIKFLPHINKLK